MFFIATVFILLVYSWTNRNDKGRYIALGTIIVLLIISSITIYKYQKTKSTLHQVMYNNYREFTSALNINYSGNSESEKNEYFKRQIVLLLDQIIEFDTISEITPMSSFFTSESMREVFPEIKEAIYSIHFKIKEEDYSLEHNTIESLSKHLSDIGFMLGEHVDSLGHNNWGVLRARIDYEESKIDRVKELVDEINQVLNSK